MIKGDQMASLIRQQRQPSLKLYMYQKNLIKVIVSERGTAFSVMAQSVMTKMLHLKRKEARGTKLWNNLDQS